MIPLTVLEVAGIVGARVHGQRAPEAGDLEAVVTAVVADSRLVAPGALFVALPGERVDGLGFVARAHRAGAVAALTARPVADAGPCLVTPDPLVALGRLARAVVDRQAAYGLAVVGITGSQGKTSTKDLLAQVLETAGPTVAPIGNLNNELGLPLTVARVDPGTRFLVAEMGARGIGHIAYLCTIAPPRVGVLLNVGHAHLGEFGSQQAIALAKSELIAALPDDGVAVLNADDPLVWDRRVVTGARVVACSDRARPQHPDAVWAERVRADDLGRYRFDLRTTEPEARVEVALRLLGRHHVGNAVAAAAAALAVGLEPAAVAAALSAAGPRSRWRMELHELADGVVLVNDAYNANPDSMRAAIAALSEIGARRGGLTWALLGDMLELGDTAANEHAELGRLVSVSGIDRLVAVGAFADDLVAAARSAGMPSAAAVAVEDKAAMTRLVRAGLRPGDTVLLKASRGLALDTVAGELEAGARAAGGGAA